MRIFVVGGTGVIGLVAVRALAAAGHEVRATARGEAKAGLVRRAGAEPVQLDIYDETALRGALRGCEAAIRLTTKIPPLTRMRSRSAWEETNRLRTLGAERLVDAVLAEGVGTYVHESFYAVYADAGERWVDEAAPTDGGGLTTMRAALSGEGQARRFTDAAGSGVVLRFGGFYGADSPGTRETVALARRRMLPQVGPGRFYFPSIHVADAARAVVHALGAPAGAYNVCDDEPLRWADYLRALTRAAGAPLPLRLPEFMGPLLFGYPWRSISRSVRLSNARFQSTTGWRPAVRSAAEGWAQVVRELETG